MKQPGLCGHAWRLLVVLVVLHLPTSTCQVCVSTGDNDGASCTPTSKSCRKEYLSDFEYTKKCRQLSDNMVPFPPGVKSCPSPPYYLGGYSPCSDDIFEPVNETLLEPVIHLYSLNWERFAVNISWPSEAATTGYMIKIKQGTSLPWGCVCVSKNITSYSFGKNIDHDSVLSSNQYNQLQQPMTIEFHWSVDQNLPESAKMHSWTHNWPASCLDVDHNDSTCALPIYDPPTNVSICKDPDPNNSTVQISWDYATDLPQPVFYVWLFTSSTDDDDEPKYIVNNSQSIAVMGWMNYNASQIGVRITPYYYCSGLAMSGNFNHLGCGNSETVTIPVQAVPNCSLPSPPTLPPSATTGTLPTPTSSGTPTPLPTIETIESGTPPWTLIIPYCAGGAILIVIILVALVLGIILRRRYIQKKGKKYPEEIDREHSVFVAYVPGDSAEKDILTHVVAPLTQHFPVTTSARKVRGDLVGWIEVQERKASVVLFVITKDFLLEWDDSLCKSHFIEAMRRLVNGGVAGGQLEDKYAIAVLQESSRHYIPDNGYLRNLNVYVLGEGSGRLEELQRLIRFIKKFKIFQHRDSRQHCDSCQHHDSRQRCDSCQHHDSHQHCDSCQHRDSSVSSDFSLSSSGAGTISLQLDVSSLDEYTLTPSRVGSSPSPHPQQGSNDTVLPHLHQILTTPIPD